MALTITAKDKKVARLLENLGNIKIELAEEILERELSVEERDDLYCQAIKDQLALVFKDSSIKPMNLFLALQIEEMFSQANIVFAELFFNHHPSDEEIQKHYTENTDRTSRFREKFNCIFDYENKEAESEIVM